MTKYIPRSGASQVGAEISHFNQSTKRGGEKGEQPALSAESLKIKRLRIAQERRSHPG